MVASVACKPIPSDSQLKDRFLAIVPKIKTHALIYFRAVRCPDTRAEKIAECVAIGWKWFVRLAERGKDASQFPKAFTILLAKSVGCGRRLCGAEKAKDVLSPVAQKKYDFKVESIYANPNGQREHDTMEERLRDNTRTPPPEQAAFRIDFPAWFGRLPIRHRRMIRRMMRNERAKDLSHEFKMSPARISQLRREFRDDWRRFVGDADEPVTQSASR